MSCPLWARLHSLTPTQMTLLESCLAIDLVIYFTYGHRRSRLLTGGAVASRGQ